MAVVGGASPFLLFSAPAKTARMIARTRWKSAWCREQEKSDPKVLSSGQRQTESELKPSPRSFYCNTRKALPYGPPMEGFNHGVVPQYHWRVFCASTWPSV